MRATFSGIEIGRTGLDISQLGLDVTAHNISNVETEGYTRQRIVQTAYDPFATIGRAIPVSEALVGGGVRVKILDQIRSAYLDRRYRTENTTNAYWLKRTEGLTYLESYFDNVNEETSINYSIGKFFEAIKVLAEDPVEGSPRKLLQTAGLDMVQQLNSIYEGLIDLQSTQNLAVKTTVDEINRMAEEIVELNKSIYGFEVTGYIANDLRDKRNLLLDQLSALIDIEYREEPDGKGGQRLTVEIGGRTLVDHDKQYLLDVRADANPIPGEEDVWIPIWAPDVIPGMDPILNQYVPAFKGLDGATIRLMNLYDPGTGMAIDMQDLDAVQKAVDRINEITSRFARITPEWTDVDTTGGANSPLFPTAEQQALFDELKGIVGAGNVEVFDYASTMIPYWGDWCVHTGLRIGGVDLGGITGWADIVYACSDPPQAQREIARVQIEPNMVELKTEDLLVTSGELKAYLDMRDNYDAKTPGIPYFIDMLNNLARSLVQEINALHREGWTDNPGGSESGINFFWANDADGNPITGYWEDQTGAVVDPALVADINERDSDGKRLYNYVIDLEEVTAKSISLSQEVMDSVYNIACSTKEIVKHGDPDELQRGNNENMNLLYELYLKKDISIIVSGNTIDIGGFDGYATSIRFDVANTLNFAKKTSVNSTVLLLAAENQRVSVSGVSLDEEMINMVKYQHAYSGASRVITAMDDMLDRLINNTGRVGL